ncbi:MAG: L,D-transpeptidase family protein [Desulfobacterales bacterium]|nr:L,D-transpeptidase family protein [Desulfobacterales bacterium]
MPMGSTSLKLCYAAGDTESLSSAISTYLDCHFLELISFEEQQLSVTSKKLCLAELYHQAGFRPLWVTPEGAGPKASIILDFLKQADAEGLDPDNYEIDQISALFGESQTQSLAELDTLLTFNLIKYIHDVSRGQIKPQYAETDLLPRAEDISFDPLVIMGNASNSTDIASYLASLPPAHEHYANLKKALMLCRSIEQNGGWPAIAAGKTIRPGDYDDRIPEIIRLLSVMGDLPPEAPRTNHYSPVLENSILRFQSRHGLMPDGVIGPNTFAAMNVPVSDRIKQIIINMTRWRWQAHDLGEKYLLVNIANFDVTAYDNKTEYFRLPVIVGKFQHQTPILSDQITSITLNPYWNIPPNIAQNEELPKLKKNSNHLIENHIRLYSGWSANASEIDSTTVDWRNVTPAKIRQYKLRQDPGPWNALGRVKFDFPNKYDVYLHDTPTQNLFSQPQRDFSHGCIRVSDPVKLAAFVLSDQKGDWTSEKIINSIQEQRHTIIRLTDSVQVHITYQTSWVDKDGILCFSSDIYGRDEKLLSALFSVN